MPEQPCQPYESCSKLDGQLLINQTVQGPSLAVPGDIGIGDLTGRSILRPYCNFGYLVRWIPKEACQAPVRSVIGLAPGETMSLETRQVEQVDFTRLVQDAVETSEIVTTSGPASQMRDREGFDRSESIWLSTLHSERFSSFWEVVGAVAGAVVGGPVGAGVGAWLGGAVDGWLGGDDGGGSGSGNSGAQDAIDEVLETVTRSESERTVTETTMSRSTLFERTVSRTFTNPYRDRSLELRFIPVFRHFEVQTLLFRFQHGLVMEVSAPRFKGTNLSARLGDFVQRQVADPRIVAVAASELGLQEDIQSRRQTRASSPLTEHLNANAEFYGRRYLRYLDARRDVGALQPAVLNTLKKTKGTSVSGEKQNALLWSRAQVRDKGVYVPLAGGRITSQALGMRQADKGYFKALDRVEGFLRKPLVRKRDVHLFMGTSVEAVPGACTLVDVPEA